MRKVFTYLGKIIVESIFDAMRHRNHEDAFRFSVRVSSILSPLCLPRRRNNIRLLFPGISKKEIRELERAHMKYDGLLRVHLAHGQGYGMDFIVVKGDDLLESALKEGKGALIVGAHNGTWWGCPWALALRGLKINVVVNPDLFPPLLDGLLFLANHYGIQVIYTGKDAHEKIQDAMERGDIVYLNVDVSLRPKRNVSVPILGAAMPMDPGPALLALVQDAPVFWASCYHLKDQRMGLTLKPEPDCGHGCELSTRDEVLWHWAGRIEEELTEYPEQWWTLDLIKLKDKDAT